MPNTLQGVTYAAMRDELASTKVAINLAPLAAMGGKALGAIEGIGAKALGTATNLASRSGGVGQQVAGGLINAGQRFGTQNMSRLAGGALVGAGALGAMGAARAAVPGPGTVR